MDSHFGFLNFSIFPLLFGCFAGIAAVLASIRHQKLVCNLVGKPFDPFILPTVILSAILLLIAIFRPYGGFKEVKFSASGRDILAIVDVSRSMLAEDIKPTRLDSAKRKLYDLTEILKTRFPGDRLGVVLFAGDAFLYLPLTTDFGAARQFIREISTNLITNPGSDIVGALEVARDAIAGAKARFPALLVLSDGEDMVFKQERLKVVIQALKDVPIFSVGIGTTDGTPLPEYGGGFIRNVKGEIVVSKLDERPLRQLSESTGGAFSHYSIGDSDLGPLLSAHRSGEAINGSFRVYDEYGSYFVGLALAALLVLATRRREIAFCILCSLAHSANADDLSDAKRAFNEGDYAKAAESFGHADKQADWKANQGYGASLYRLGKFDQAAKVFKNGLTEDVPVKRAVSEFNLGNALYQSGDYEEAIAAYERSLKIADDAKTKFNLELAKKKLEEKKNQSSNKDTNSKQDKQDQQNQHNEDSQKNSDQQQSSSSSAGSDSSSSSGSDSHSSTGTDNPADGSSSSSGNDQNGSGESSSSSTDGAESSAEAASGSSSSSGVNPATQQWLDSLPDDRLILQHRTGHAPKGSQTW